MKTKRVGKWVIVLFLLAALPGMTAVMAQGQPPGKLMPAVEGPSESAASYSYWESEPNNTFAQAQVIALGDGIGAMFSPRDTDVDYFKFQIHDKHTAILIDTDRDGSEADTIVTLYNSQGVEIGFNDDADGLDSLLYSTTEPGWYTVKVVNYPLNECELCTYELYVTSPLLISAAAAGLGTASVEGITFESRDILAFSYLADNHLGQAQHKWVMFLDATDVGFTKPLVNLATTSWHCDGTWQCDADLERSDLAVGFSVNQPLVDYDGEARTAKPWDWVTFQIDQVGPNSAISHIEVHPGAAHGLTTAAEKLDALAIHDSDWWSFVFFSTTGAAAVPESDDTPTIVKLADEDVLTSFAIREAPLWENTRVVDGSVVTGLGVEDVFAADLGPAVEWDLTLDAYLTILGSGTILGHKVTQKDIFALHRGEDWNDWNHWNGLVWHGPDWGWNYNIDAFDWPGN